MTIVICSTSAWLTLVRREHAIAASAARAGHPVVFIEAPLDVRALGAPASGRAWLEGLRMRPREVGPGIRVLPQATLVPGHHSDAAQSIDAQRLRRALAAAGAWGAVVIATQPWQWPAVSAAPASRRVFDCTDDWRALIPRRADAIDALYRRIAREADAVILASGALVGAFRGGAVSVVRNGVGEALLHTPLSAPPGERRMLYVGTLSERFDAPFLAAVMALLPSWSVELHGECRYARRGSAPGDELKQLLREHRGRASWHGPVGHAQLAETLDRGRVLIAPHRAALALGQDSMKLYDYAARDRPIVCTPGALGERAHVDPAGVVQADTPASFAAVVASAAERENPRLSEARRRWVLAHRWESRWPRWADAALGPGIAQMRTR
jgi:glycosyltransferase involved in cell wall biosynthesis